MAKKPLIDMSGLEKFSLDQADEQAQAAPEQAVSDGRPLEIPLDEITEDPNQPRKDFEEGPLKELAASIALFGILQPISVRPNPEGQGYIINSGARRYRASRLAEQKTIRAFIQTEYDRYGQMAENIHRDNLNHLEIAAFVRDEVQQGKKKAAIARALGKSPQYVNQYAKLGAAPDWIQNLSASGACGDINTLTEIATLAESGKVENLQEVIAGMENISRAEVKKLSRPEPITTESAQENDQGAATHQGGASIQDDDHGQGSAADEGDQGVETHQGGAFTHDEDHSQGTAIDENSQDQANGTKAKKDKEPNLEKAVFVGGRKGYIQTKQIEIWWDDVGEFEKIPLKDLPPEALQD